MSQLDEQRRRRAAAGSRRKRDQEAAAPQAIDWNAWVQEHFPDEFGDFMFGYVLMHAQLLYTRQPKRLRKLPTPDEVLKRMESFGHTRQQFEERFNAKRSSR